MKVAFFCLTGLAVVPIILRDLRRSAQSPRAPERPPVISSGVAAAGAAPPPPPPVAIGRSYVSLSPYDVLDAQVVEKPAPLWPPAMSIHHTPGVALVQISADEQGLVERAEVVDGPPSIRQAVREAALRARPRPKKVNGRAVKTSGLLTYQYGVP